MDTPTQDIPRLETIYTLEDIIKQVEASGVNLGDDPAKRINAFIDNGLLPRPKNGRFASFVVQRIIAIQNKLQEGKSISELKEEVSKERRRFLNQVTDLNSMSALYHKFSSNSLFFLASLLLVAMVSIGILGASLSGSSNPVVVAGESIVKAALDTGAQVAKTAAKPLGNTLVTIIKTNKPEDSKSADPLGLTNLEIETTVIPENLVQLNEGGDIELDGSITANNFFGDLLWPSVVERPAVLSAIDGVENDEGNIDLIAGSGITILPDDDLDTITFSSIDSGSSQFIFKNIAVSGQSTIISDLNNDTLTFVAGSNVALTTNATTDSITIGVTGTVSNADTLDLLDSTAFAALADNETISGRYTFAGTGGMPLFIKPSAAVGGDHFEIQTSTGTSLLRVSGTGQLYINAHLYTGGTIRVGNDGTLYNINNITASGTVDFSGPTTITDDLTIGDGLTGGDYLTVTSSGVANAITTTKNSDRILLQGAYWDGGASQTVEMQIMNNVLNTTPEHSISFLVSPGVEVARFESDGDAQIYGNLTLTSGGGLFAAGDISTGGTQRLDSAGALSNITGFNQSSGTAQIISDATTAIAVNFSSTTLTTGPMLRVINLNGSYTGKVGLDGALLSVRVDDNLATRTDAFVGQAADFYLNSRYGADLTDSGSVLTATRSLSNIAGGTTVIVTGNVMDISNSYPTVAGTITDSGTSIATFTQNCGTGVTCDGSTVQISNASTGDLLALNSTGAVTTDNAIIIAATNAAGIITNAIDVSDAEIVNSINIGANPITTSGGVGITVNCAVGNVLTDTDVNGGIVINGTCAANDYAERFPSVQQLTVGDVVAIDKLNKEHVVRSESKYDGSILGVVAEASGLVIGENGTPIALLGRVPTKVSTENGPIAPGDPLTSSSTLGVAMKATKSGPIIGKALEGYSGSGVSSVMTFVSTGWYVAPMGVDVSSQISDVSNIDYETLFAQSISTQVLFIGERKISFGKNGALKIDGNVEVDGEILARKISTDELVISSGTSGNDEVKAAQTSVTIENDRVKEDSKILVTFTSDYSPATRFWTTKAEGESFTLMLNQPVTENSTFDWIIIN